MPQLVSLAAPMQTPDSPQVCVAIPDPRSQDLGPEGPLEVWASREGSTCAAVLPEAVRCTGLSRHHLARVDRWLGSSARDPPLSFEGENAAPAGLWGTNASKASGRILPCPVQ